MFWMSVTIVDLACSSGVCTTTGSVCADRDSYSSTSSACRAPMSKTVLADVSNDASFGESGGGEAVGLSPLFMAICLFRFFTTVLRFRASVTASSHSPLVSCSCARSFSNSLFLASSRAAEAAAHFLASLSLSVWRRSINSISSAVDLLSKGFFFFSLASSLRTSSLPNTISRGTTCVGSANFSCTAVSSMRISSRSLIAFSINFTASAALVIAAVSISFILDISNSTSFAACTSAFAVLLSVSTKSSTEC
mmetsp:Transcript_75877/g.127536  ORF Transcript_75877/g.127536 Transcript_75877/m.127536 type:complete len:251 (+) Transcript_75877:399-1151(+)